MDGRVRRDGGPIEEIRAGDIVWFEPGEWLYSPAWRWRRYRAGGWPYSRLKARLKAASDS